jgi:hypothetical protein
MLKNQVTRNDNKYKERRLGTGAFLREGTALEATEYLLRMTAYLYKINKSFFVKITELDLLRIQ